MLVLIPLPKRCSLLLVSEQLSSLQAGSCGQCRRQTILGRPSDMFSNSSSSYVSRFSSLFARKSTSLQNATMQKPLNLQLGWPSKSLFPAEALNDASTTVLLDPAKAGDALVYGADQGYEPLRESLAAWLTEFYKPKTGNISPSSIFVANGASGALNILLAKFTDPVYTRHIFMVEPTYFLACPIFEDAGFQGRLKGVPEDEEGVDIEYLRRELDLLEEGAKVDSNRSLGKEDCLKSSDKYPKLYKYVIYAVPTFSNPSGKIMSLRRRKELVQLAREYDALIVTDDVYDMLRWPIDPSTPGSELPSPPPRLIDVDREIPGQSSFGNVCSNGSFSKIIGPGIRVSWIDATPTFAHTTSTHGATKSGGAPGHMASVFVDQMVRNGSLNNHIDEVLRATYRKRYSVMMKAIGDFLEPLGVKVTTGQAYQHESSTTNQPVSEAGGFFTYITLPDDVQPAEKVAKISLESYRLKVAFGQMMVVAGDKNSSRRAKDTFGRGLRLSWSWHTEEDIQQGIERLAQVLKDIRAGTVPDKNSSVNDKELAFR